eukprot:TRINITY_DN8952_c0_g1_i1.p1 TRINITY_DN8952_c0_g1~~TRINITY_DN8952_c0_g1_i1.p1  ORF type:complete len:569 (+),score=83.46 TRINITY_DN8952_c0_g1_i1:86-1792(+)
MAADSPSGSGPVIEHDEDFCDSGSDIEAAEGDEEPFMASPMRRLCQPSSDDDDYGVPSERARGSQAQRPLTDLIKDQSADFAAREASFCEYQAQLGSVRSGASPRSAPAAGGRASLLRPYAAGEHPPPGRLYAWGKASGKGGAGALPVAPAAVDAAGDCIYPAPVVFSGCKPGSEPRFIKAGADQGVFAALTEDGHLWAWTAGQAKGVIPCLPPKQIRSAVCDCAVGAGFVAAVLDDHTVAIGGAARAPLPAEGTDWRPVHWDGPDAGGGAISVEACSNCIIVMQGDRTLWSAGSGPTGHDKDKKLLTKLADLPPIHSYSVGSLHAAACGRDGSLWVWGCGLSGNLGTGDRKAQVRPVRVELPGVVRAVGCTRGQQGPKRMGNRGSFKSGQEGPRCHAITEDGKLWIAGTTHKGLGADHLNKTLQPAADHLTFYCVGGKAADASATVCWTGAAEDMRVDTSLAHWRMGVPDGCFGKEGVTGYLQQVQIVSSTPSHIHSLALTSDGRAFAWGCGSDGRTGLRAFMRGPGGSKRTLKCYVSTPSQIEALEDKRVHFITSGRWYSLAIVGS